MADKMVSDIKYGPAVAEVVAQMKKNGFDPLTGSNLTGSDSNEEKPIAKKYGPAVAEVVAQMKKKDETSV